MHDYKISDETFVGGRQWKDVKKEAKESTSACGKCAAAKAKAGKDDSTDASDDESAGTKNSSDEEFDVAVDERRSFLSADMIKHLEEQGLMSPPKCVIFFRQCIFHNKSRFSMTATAGQ